MKKQLVFDEFVKACYEYGGFLADMEIRCVYFIGAAVENGGNEHFAMEFGCADGAFIAVDMNERKPEVWLKVIKNETVNGEFKQTRFADEFHTDLQELFESIEKHVELHEGFNEFFSDGIGDEEVVGYKMGEGIH